MSKYPLRHLPSPGVLLHGENNRNSAEYRSWVSMKRRCYNENSKDYKYYGGKGVKVCTRWVHDYLAFLGDMGRRPTPLHTLERSRIAEDYSPDNCVWATRKSQARNRSTTRVVQLCGRAVSMAEFIETGYPGEEIDVVRSRIDARIQRGKSFQEATFDAQIPNPPIEGVPVDVTVL